MPKTPQQRTQSVLQPQPLQMPSARMETKKPKSPNRLWLLISVLVLLLIVSVAGWQTSKSSQSSKNPTQATQLAGGQVQATHDMDHVLTNDPVQPTHDIDHVLTNDPVQPTHDMDHSLSVDPAQPTHDMDHVLSPGP
jgi:hypothetical protein